MSKNINKHIQSRFGLATKIGKSVAENDTIYNILSRRSHRLFNTDNVSEDLLDTLLATAFSAPSKSDLQQACVINVQDKAKQQRIANASSKTLWAANSPIFLVWCGDSRRIRKLSDWRGHKFANDHLDAFMNAAVDAAICMQTFIVAAESYGLGCCPVSEIRDHIQLLSDELNLPQHVFPVSGLCVGWPQDKPSISMRLPLSTTVQIDTYDDKKLFEEIAEYDLRRKNFEEELFDQQGQAEEPEYGGWSKERSKQYSTPARDDFGEYIRSQGFNLS